MTVVCPLCGCDDVYGTSTTLFQFSPLPLFLYMAETSGDILECIGILISTCTAVACGIRSTAICQLALFEERLQTVFLNHQDGAWCSKVVWVVFVSIVESWKRDGCCVGVSFSCPFMISSIGRVTSVKITCWRLEVSTVLLTCQLLQVRGIVLNLVELQYLFCTIETVVSDAYSYTVCNAVLCLDGLVAGPVEDKLCIPDSSAMLPVPPTFLMKKPGQTLCRTCNWC